jgi:hypothetical protein
MVEPESRTADRVIFVKNAEVPVQLGKPLRTTNIQESDIQDGTFPSADTTTTDRVYEPSPIDAIADVASKLTDSVQETAFDLIG